MREGMFGSMMRLIEQQQVDGAVRRPEFEPPPDSEASLSDEERGRLIAFLASTTPDRHKFVAAGGRVGVVYFDTRGRAVSAVLDDLDDDTLQWIAQSKNMDGTPMATSDPGYTPPVQEEVGAAKFWKSKSQGLWFVPLAKQKNGGWSGLMLDLSFSKKPKKKSVGKVEQPYGRHEWWVEADPSDEIRGYFQAHPDFSGKVVEEVGFRLTPKSRTVIERFVYSEFPPDSKMKKGGRMYVMLTGDAAKLLGEQRYTSVYLDAVPCSRLVDLAKALGYSGAIQKVEERSPMLTDQLEDLA